MIDTTDSAFDKYWDTLYSNDPQQNPFYGVQVGGRGDAVPGETRFSDRSFMVVYENEPVIGCSLTLHTDSEGRKRMGYFGVGASSHVNRNSLLENSNGFQPEAIQLLQQHIRGLIDAERPDSLEYFDPVSCGMMSPVTQVLLEKGAKPTVYKAQVIKLALSERALLRLVSEQYRRPILWGQENLEFDIVTGASVASELSPLSKLFNTDTGNHIQGSEGFLNACEVILGDDNGFLVQAMHEGNLVARALFVHNDRTSHYVIGEEYSMDHSQPLLQSLIWQAVLHSKNLGCAHFELGDAFGQLRCNQGNHGDRLLPERFGGESQTRLKVSLIQ